MQIYKNRHFTKWALKEKLGDDALLAAIDEITSGLVDADLGGHVFKKRIRVGGRGKSAGVRTLLVYRQEDRAFFVYGFAKSTKANISEDELKALKLLARELLSYSNKSLAEAVKAGELFKVKR
jgi:hypothetical protein